MRRLLQLKAVFGVLAMVVAMETIGWTLAPWRHHPFTRWGRAAYRPLPLGPGHHQLRAIVYDENGTLRVDEYVEHCNITSVSDLAPPPGVLRARVHWDEFGDSFGLWSPAVEVFRHDLGIWPETGPALTPTERAEVRSQSAALLRKIAWLPSVTPPGFVDRLERGDGTLVVWHWPWIVHDLTVLAAAVLATASGCMGIAASVRRRTRERRTARGLCPACAYDMSASVDGTCPECGSHARDVGREPPTAATPNAQA